MNILMNFDETGTFYMHMNNS